MKRKVEFYVNVLVLKSFPSCVKLSLIVGLRLKLLSNCLIVDV